MMYRMPKLMRNWRAIEREGNWEDVDTEINEESKITADVSSLDEDGNLVDETFDTDQSIDMRQDSLQACRRRQR